MLEELRGSPVVPYAEGRPAARVVMVTGRRSGQPRPFGVNVTTVDGRHYACSATRERAWVRNLLAAGRCRIERDGADGSDTERVPVLVDGPEAARVLSIYLPQAGFRDPVLPYDLDAPVEEISRHLDHTAVIRFDPV